MLFKISLLSLKQCIMFGSAKKEYLIKRYISYIVSHQYHFYLIHFPEISIHHFSTVLTLSVVDNEPSVVTLRSLIVIIKNI